jgi:cytochrome c-type biogenesis protein CcmH/NrfF
MSRYGARRLRWPRSRAVGCLLWIVLLVVLLIVLSVLFGGFQKGTQYKGLGPGLTWVWDSPMHERV